jgi:hypothetical protein
MMMRTTAMRQIVKGMTIDLVMTTKTMMRMIRCKKMRKPSIAMMMKRMEPPVVVLQATPRKPNLPHKRRLKATIMAMVVSASLTMTKTKRIRSPMTMMRRRSSMRPST